MTTKAKAEQVVQSYGGEIDWASSTISRGDKLVFVDAPAGKVWSFNGCSVIAHSYYSGPAREFWSDVIELVNHGTHDDSETPIKVAT